MKSGNEYLRQKQNGVIPSITRFIGSNIYPISLIIILVFTVLLIHPWAEVAINDDWDFFLHVGYFYKGIFMKNNLADATLIFQAFLGMLWAKLFGLSFVSLRLLSICFYILFSLGVYKLLTQFGFNPKKAAILALLIMLNPLVMMAGLSFMTEIYFLTFLVWGIYYYKKCELSPSLNNYVMLFLLAGASVLERQFGIVFFLALIFTELIYALFVKKLNVRFLAVSILVFVLFFGMTLLFPTAPNLSGEHETIRNLLIRYKDLGEALFKYGYIFVYLAFFLLPILISKLNWKRLLLALPLSWLVYSYDIFPIGNTFYIEKLYAKVDFVHKLNLFDNIPFKLVLSYLIALAVVNLVLGLAEAIKTYVLKKNPAKYQAERFTIFYVLLTVGMFASASLIRGLFDRYYLNFLVLAILGVAVVYYQNRNIQKYTYGLCIGFLWIISTFLNMDFFAAEDLKWQIANRVKADKNITYQIHVNGTFMRYYSVEKHKNPMEIDQAFPNGVGYVCFVDSNTDGSGNILYKILARFENSRTLNKWIKNPEIYNDKTSDGFRNISQYKDREIYKQTYFSPLYAPLGIESYVAASCINPKNMSK